MLGGREGERVCSQEIPSHAMRGSTRVDSPGLPVLWPAKNPKIMHFSYGMTG